MKIIIVVIPKSDVSMVSCRIVYNTPGSYTYAIILFLYSLILIVRLVPITTIGNTRYTPRYECGYVCVDDTNMVAGFAVSIFIEGRVLIGKRRRIYVHNVAGSRNERAKGKLARMNVHEIRDSRKVILDIRSK